jgi:hypothetical protein
MNIRELRTRYPFRPLDCATLDDGRQVEVISYPFPDDPRPASIIVRTVPGDPASMIEVQADRLKGSNPAGA